MSKQELDSIKEDLRQDLSGHYYKMTQAKIITIIGCTITACTFFIGGIVWLNTSLTTDRIEIIQCKANDAALFGKCDNLQVQINNIRK